LAVTIATVKLDFLETWSIAFGASVAIDSSGVNADQESLLTLMIIDD
jgi:hypothetical protein